MTFPGSPPRSRSSYEDPANTQQSYQPQAATPQAPPSPTSSISSGISSSTSTTTTSRSSVLSPASSKLLSSVTVSGGAAGKITTSVPVHVNRSLEEQDLLNLTYGSQIVLRVCTGKFVCLEEAPRETLNNNPPPNEKSAHHRYTVHGASNSGYPFTILNAGHLGDRSEVKFQDSICLLSADGTFLSAEGSGPGSSGNLEDQRLEAFRNDVTDVRCKWYLLCGQHDLLMSGQFYRARGMVKIFDTILLKSFTGQLVGVDETDILGRMWHRERGPRMTGHEGRTTNINSYDAPPPTIQPCVLSLARAHLPIVPAWLRFRGGSLSAHPPGSGLSVESEFLPDSKPLGDFNQRSTIEQEQLLLEDLLYALVGVEGRYIRLVQQEGGEERVNFVASPYITDLSLVETLERILPLCGCYFAIQTYIQVHSRYEYGLVTHAFSACLRTILKEYLVLIAQLEHQFVLGKLTLLRTWFYLQSSVHTFMKLDQLCLRVNRTIGGTFLNVLYQSLQHAGDESTKALYTHLLQHSSRPYFEMLKVWLTQGIIEDMYEEFQIRQHEERKKENVKKDFNDMYWDERYTIRTERVPVFLEKCQEQNTHTHTHTTSTTPHMILWLILLVLTLLRCFFFLLLFFPVPRVCC